MGLDPALAAAVTLRHQRGTDGHCSADDEIFQLSLADVLLDGGYDGVVRLSEVMDAGDHGLGTVDRLDGELVVVDGEPWRVDHTGRAEIVSPETLTPFVVLTTIEHPRRIRLRDVDRDGVIAAIDQLVDDRAGVVAVRLEGRFTRVLVRSVPAQDPPYRPYIEVCATDEVRWEHHDFNGVFVGFSFPDLGSGATIAGLHLHGLDTDRTTGGHNHELVVDDAELTVSTSHDITLALPDRSMIELLEMPDEIRSVQRSILRHGPQSVARLAADLGIDEAEASRRLHWLADRGFAEEGPADPSASGQGGTDASGAPVWRITMRSRRRALPDKLDDLLRDL